MTFDSYRNRFQGKLAGINVNELGILDRNLETLKERLDYVRKKYERVSKFYDAYIFTKEQTDGGMILDKYDEDDFREFYKYSLNCSDSLSEEINIFQYIQNDATYLLNSSDLEKDEKNKYANRVDDVSLDEVIAQVEASKENYRLAPKVDIKKSDLILNSLFAGTYENYLKNHEENNKIKNYVPSKQRTDKKMFSGTIFKISKNGNRKS